MAEIALSNLVGIIFVSFCVLSAALIVVARVFRTDVPSQEPEFDPHEFEPAVFLFDNRLLIDATDRAKAILARTQSPSNPWQQLVEFLSGAFSKAEDRLLGLQRGEKIDIWSDIPAAVPMRLVGEWRNGMLRVTVIETDEAEVSVLMDTQSVFSMERDARLLGQISEFSPTLIWKTSASSGEVSWANKSYLDIAAQINNDPAPQWPAPHLFSTSNSTQREGGVSRCALETEQQNGPNWFDVRSQSIGSETLHFAIPADDAVRAEGALREFIQTLAKTFAHLPIGLAIFNHDRQLVLFNPALTDLTSLDGGFLGGRPSLFSFLDELRNRRVMPEPKDYKTWRQEITALESEASQGTYAEIWTLPTGLTYRVTGRPHPEGALALLFEDISSEVSLSRRFKTDMDLGQAVLDSIPEAIAVFSQNGALTLSNQKFSDLWGIDSRLTLGNVSVADIMKTWIEKTKPTPIWADARDFVGTPGERAEWASGAELKNGRKIHCRFVPLAGGDTLMGFQPQSIRSVEPKAKETISLLD